MKTTIEQLEEAQIEIKTLVPLLKRARNERNEAREEAKIEKTRADGHHENYCQILKRIDVVANERDEARDKAEENHWRAKAVAGERDKALAEVEQLKQALHDARLENSGQAAQLEQARHHIPDVTKMIKPEPSRLEIAAMFKSAWFANSDYNSSDACDDGWWIEQADKLIEANKKII
jgi:uncharacterized coiled-coil DUF342 family protein